MSVVEFGVQPSEFWKMTVAEWFWAIQYRLEKAEAEAEMAKAAGDKNHVPEEVWDELRAEHDAKKRLRNGK